MAGSHTGVAVLLMLARTDAARIAVAGGEDPAAMHVTLGFLAAPAADYTDTDRQRILDALTEAPLPSAAIEAAPFGTALLNPADPDRDPCAVILVQSGDLADAHHAVEQAIGGDLSRTFPIWIPHVTIGYGIDPGDIPADAFDGPLTFDRVVLSWAGDLIDLDPVLQAQEAFITGYARATARLGLPLTERARIALRALTAAVGEAQPSGDATLQLGQLEGIWAVIYARREAIEHLHTQALADVLAAIKKLDWSQVIDNVGRQLRIDPNITGAQLEAELGRTVEDLIATQLPTDVRAQWMNSMADALTDAAAEGRTAALSLVGDAAGVQIDWDLVAADAKKALAGGQGLTDDAGAWVARQTHGIGWQVGRKLAALWDAGASPADMETAIVDLLDVNTSVAAVLLDTAIGQSLSAGAAATYTQADVAYLDFVTAGDGRVCPVCADAEDEGPYLIEAAPMPPLHPSCRCTVSPSDYQPTATALTLLAPYQDTEDEEDAAA